MFNFAALAPLILRGIDFAIGILERNRELEKLRTKMALEGRTELTAEELAIVDRVIAYGREVEAKLRTPPG